MGSKLTDVLNLKHHPVALVWTDEKPVGALEFGRDKWGCIMYHLVAAAKGRTAVIGRDTYGCVGGGVGMGFGNCYRNFPGGCEGFHRFLSSGNADEPGAKEIHDGIAASGNEKMADDFLHGECYLKNPEVTQCFVENLPIQDIPAEYVVLKPLEETDLDTENVHSITLLVDPDQLSALVVLANHEHPERENVAIPFGAGCQIIGVFMYRELDSDQPRALVGLTDISARKNVRRILGKDVMSFSMTPSMYREMEANVEGSFLERNTWSALAL
jgi:hypothetical protein